MSVADKFRALLQAARESERPALTVLAEALRLHLGLGKLGLSEYLDFKLYLNDLSPEQKAAFGGWRAQRRLEEILVDEYSRFLSLDKLTMYTLLRGFGFPVPELRAVFGTARPKSCLNLPTVSALEGYLSDPANYPVYLKPAFGAYGRGNTLLCGIAGDRLSLGDGSDVSLRQFCQSLQSGDSLGWLLQEPLASHPQLAAVCGNKISSVRIHTFLGTRGPETVSALLKINAGKGDCDNFRHGESGNLLGALDLETGRITRVVSGTGRTQTIVQSHPVSGQLMIGLQLPCWREVNALALDAQLAFPGYLCPGWDIALCPDGPRILEVNFFGDIDLPQHAYRKGFLDDKLIGLMNTRGLALALTHAPRLRCTLRGMNRPHAAVRAWPW